jgi:hypothetical protein
MKHEGGTWQFPLVTFWFFLAELFQLAYVAHRVCGLR